MAGLSDMIATSAPTQYAAPPQTAPVAGTRTGEPPQAPQPMPATGDYASELAKYELSADDKAKQAKQEAVLDYTPNEADMENLTKAVTSKIKLDGDLMQQALRGDDTAMQQMLSNFGEQLVKQTLLASTSASTALTNLGATRTVERAQQAQEVRSKQDNLLKQAVAADERFSQPKLENMLRSTLADLTAKYPNAPAELLVQAATGELHDIIGKPVPKAPQMQTGWGEAAETDWSKEFNW